MRANVDASDPSVGVRRRHLPSNDAGEEKTAADLMDRLYRRQRHVYDFTRKYYLLGRDRLIDRLAPPPGGRVLEIGCGTARNLVSAARVHPGAAFFGIDISQEMLVTARRVVVRAGLASHIRLARADATSFDPDVLFDVPAFSRVYFSYSLSMIPAWPAALEKALACLAPAGEIHIVDFGGQERLPQWFRAGLRRWLEHFHVHPRDQLEAELVRLRAIPTVERPFGGYAQYLVCRRV
jgi:S-adenosylmethionine-diacylgycerolhomoserine-N-methlytransferase